MAAALVWDVLEVLPCQPDDASHALLDVSDRRYQAQTGTAASESIVLHKREEPLISRG